MVKHNSKNLDLSKPANVALIPARGGSKRLPGKNLLPFLGRPMLQHTVEAAVESGVFAKVIFSSDDPAMRDAAAAAGAAIHERSVSLAGDGSELIEVVRNVVVELDLASMDNLCLMMPNCPLRNAEDIRASWQAFRGNGGGFQISVYRFPMFNPFWSLEHRDGILQPVWPGLFSNGPKLHPGVVLPTGAIWWATLEKLLEAGDFYGPGLQPCEIPWQRAVDIDTAEDFRLARILAAAMSAEPDLFPG